jgi:hypothetical protein
MVDTDAVPSFNLTDEELNISAEPDISLNDISKGDFDLLDIAGSDEMSMGDTAMEDSFDDLFFDSDPTAGASDKDVHQVDGVVVMQSVDDEAPSNESLSGLVSSIEAATGKTNDPEPVAPSKLSKILSSTAEPASESGATSQSQDFQQPTQGFLAQLSAPEFGGKSLARKKMTQPDVIDFSASEEPTVEVPQAAHKPPVHAVLSKQPSSTLPQSAINIHAPTTKASTSQQASPSSETTNQSNLRNGQSLPKVRKFMKLPLSHWAWIEAEQFLRTGCAELQDLGFFREYKADLQEIYDLNKAQEDLDNGLGFEVDEPSTRKQRRPSVAKGKAPAKSKAKDGLPEALPAIGNASRAPSASALPKAAPKSKVEAVPSARTCQAPKGGPSQPSLPKSLVPTTSEASLKPASQTPKKTQKPQTPVLVAPKRQQQQPQTEKPRIERPRNEQPPRAEALRIDSPTPELPPRPQFGGKSLSPSYYAAIQARQLEEENDDDLGPDDENEIGAVDTHYERGREASPITEGDELRFSYHVIRKQWYDGEVEANATSVGVGSERGYDSKVAAINAAFAESKRTLNGLAWDFRTGVCRFGPTDDEDIPWEWHGDMHHGFIRIRIKRRFHAAGCGTRPDSKSGFLPSKVWRIMKEVWTRARKETAPPVSSPRKHAEDRDSNSNDSLDELFEDKEESEDTDMTNAEEDGNVNEDGDAEPDRVNEDGDADNDTKCGDKTHNDEKHPATVDTGIADTTEDITNDDHYDLTPQVCEQPKGSYTMLDHANRNASRMFMDECFDKESKKIDDVNGRKEVEKWYEEVKEQKLPMDMEDVVDKGERKVRYWVEEDWIMGPKNA